MKSGRTGYHIRYARIFECADMKYLISAIQFITILPIGKPGTFAPEGMVPYFPVVGLIIGALAAILDIIACTLWSRPLASILDIIFLVWVTGAFHLDGLGDMADGIYGGRGNRERALEIMKDSRIGSMALVTVVCTLAVKWGGLTDMIHSRSLFLLLIPAYSRGATLFAIRFLDYGRPGGGTAHDLFGNRPGFSAFWGMILPVILSLFCGWRGLWFNLFFACGTSLILVFYKRRMGCVTGDMLGAMTELMEAILFLAAATGGAV